MDVQKPRVLIIEDEAIIALNIARILEVRGYDVAGTLSSGQEAVDIVAVNPPDCILMDIVLSGAMDGIETAEKISSFSDAPIIYLTAHTDDETLQRAKATGPYGYVVKPINPEELISTVEITLFKHQAEKRVRESEERYRSFVENFQGIAFQYGVDFTPVFFHGAVAEITGYTEEDFISGTSSWEKIVHPEDLVRVRADNVRIKAEPGNRLHRNYRIINANNDIRWVDEYIQNTSPAKGGSPVLRGVILDVTERKQAEEIIREKRSELEILNEELNQTIEELESTNEEFEEQNRELIFARNELERSEFFLRSIFRAAPAGIGIVVNRVLGWTNEMIHRMTGYSEEGLSGRSSRILYPDDDEFEFVGKEKYVQILKHGTGTVETRWKRKDGAIIDVLLSSTPLDPGDHSKGVTFTALDITGRKKVERDLREARRAWEDIFQAIGHPTFILDREYTILSANRAAQASLNKSETEIIGRKCFTLFHHGDSEPENCPLRGMIEKGEMASAEMVIEALNGVYLVSCTPVKDVEGRVDKIIHIAMDITERKRVETALRMSEERYRNLVETMRDGMVILDADGVFIYVNPRACEMFGYSKEDLLGKRPRDFLDEKNRDVMARQMEKRKEGTIDIYELEWPRPDGGNVLILVSPKVMYDDKGRFSGSFGVITDITERRRSEELMLQNEKMMTIGSLAAGMAHEINNPLGIILQGVQAAQLKLSPEFELNKKLAGEFGIDIVKLGEYLEKSDILVYLDGIAKAGLRASEIVTSMLQFSRRSSGQKIKSDMHEIIERTIEMASRDYDLKKKYDFKKITLVREYSENLPPIECVPMEIEQVLLNLLKNAAYAIGEISDPDFVARISLKTGMEEGSAVIEVSDNGTGIDDYTRKHIFEPFYTTKGPGEGTGLGLAVSFFIISKNHHGTITVHSQEGQGTTFIIRLPIKEAGA